MATYVDLLTVHNPTTGLVIPAAWGDQIRENEEFLVDPPACSVYNSAAVSVATATATSMGADSELFDNGSLHSTSVNTSRITAGLTSRYLVTTTVDFDPSATGSRRVDFRVNGATLYKAFNIGSSSGASNFTLTGARLIVLNAGDYVEVRVTHTHGANLNVTLLEFGAVWQTRA